MAEALPGSLQSALADFARWLEAARIPAVIIGGVAASLLGRPRFTRDVDALAILPEAHWRHAIETAAAFGIMPRIEGALEFAQSSRVLLMRHTPSAVDLDVTLGGLPFEEAVVRAGRPQEIGGVRVNLPRVEDLLVMKAVAHRPRDIEDIRGLLAAHPEADLVAVRRWVHEFAAATGMPEMLQELDRVLAERPREA